MDLKFESEIQVIHDYAICRIPIDISQEFPSRGMNFAQITISSEVFEVNLEPDGQGSHWFYWPKGTQAMPLENKPLTVSLKLLTNWSPPITPADFENALEESSQLVTYLNFSTKAQWEWIRWLQMTTNPQTRNHRILTSLDKIQKGMKRPCCFDQTRCTDYKVCRNGRL